MPAERTARGRDRHGRFSRGGSGSNVSPRPQDVPVPPVEDQRPVFDEGERARLRQQVEVLDGQTLHTKLLDIMTGSTYTWAGQAVSQPSREAHFKIACTLVRTLDIDLLVGTQSDAIRRLHTLHNLSSQRPPLPFLQDLHVQITQPEHLDAVFSLLHPGLRTFSLRFASRAPGSFPHTKSPEWDSRFRLLFPKLSSIWEGGGDDEVVFHLRELPTLTYHALPPRPFNTLRIFKGDATTVYHKFVSALTASPNLRCYELDTTASGVVSLPPDLEDGLRTCRFRFLRTLILCSDWPVVKAIIHTLDCGVEKLELNCRCTMFSNEEGSTLFPENAAWLRTLRNVSVTIRETASRETLNQAGPIHWAAFRGFLRCRSILTFTLTHSRNDFNFSDDDLINIARSWPEVVDLKFLWTDQAHQALIGTGAPDGTILTLRAFPFLALHCPNLKALRLSSVNGRGGVPPVGTAPSSPHSFVLELGLAEIEETKSVALLLYRLWPRAEISVSPSNRSKAKWSSATDFIALLHCAAILHEDPDALQRLGSVAPNDVLSNIRSIARSRID